ncbi:Serpentine Receptor, class T [Caenorhabditis elegans]|uniref:Serpentine Receptor, class T n=1 Tax=Caenorhabditis elegans TaxID=6239 RepID=O16494_CAEEL|nr:Serpentine Receptor, class T [Caenorhabditis elegans]CCD61485.1 Serpentine Receptor, class T [Caenorhabditis elegans]|eukprot:NP_504403.2 Serpentine Receptor, class T [Caenorhabditis elegans]
MKSPNSTSIFTFNEDPEMLRIGIIYFLFTIFIPPLLIIVIKVTYINDRRAPNFPYKLMIIVLTFQLLQSTGHFITSPVLVFPKILKGYEVIVRVIGCMINSSWIGDLPMMSLLSVSRVLIFTNTIKTSKFPIFVKLSVVCILSWVVYVFLYGCITQNFMFVPPGWAYDLDAPHAAIFAHLEIGLSFLSLTISYLSYLAIDYIIRKKTGTSNSQFRKNEIRILAQSTFVTVHITSMICVWHSILIPEDLIDMTSVRNQATLNLFWISHCYFHPIMILVFNK